MSEIWKDIPNYNGYQVSNKGRVRTHNKISQHKLLGERHWKDRVLKFKNTTANKTGYRVDLWKDNKPISFLVARLVAFTFYNEDINNHELTVNHIDGNRLNNNLENLELISLADNIRHAFDNGLMPTNKPLSLINTITGEKVNFNSMSKAGLYLGRNKGYISCCKQNNRKIISKNGTEFKVI